MPEFPNWFNVTARENFDEQLKSIPIRYPSRTLQLGVFTGDASLYLLERFPLMVLDDVDTWEGSDEVAHETLDFKQVFDAYLTKTLPYEDRVTPYIMPTRGFFAIGGMTQYDFIYVDASHTAFDVLEDAVNAHHRLKVGGIMAFDDYMWAPHLDAQPWESPNIAATAFVNCFRPYYRVIANNGQLWVKRTQ